MKLMLWIARLATVAFLYGAVSCIGGSFWPVAFAYLYGAAFSWFVSWVLVEEVRLDRDWDDWEADQRDFEARWQKIIAELGDLIQEKEIPGD